MEDRAAVFTSRPQAVELYQAGTWWAGELLGWRHDANGSCQVRVRVVLDGVEETAWTGLGSLRLPERHLATADSSGPAVFGSGTQEMAVARHPSGRRARSGDAEGPATAGLSMVRDPSVVPDPQSTGGRRTADETAQFASVGRRRAPEDAEKPVTGRRRAPETAGAPSTGRRGAPDAVPARAGTSAVPGRHRAPGDPRGHRTADTCLIEAVPEMAESATARVSPAPVAGNSPRSRPSVRPEESATRAGWTAPEGLEPELLTRPMHLSDHLPYVRRSRVDGLLRGV